MAHSKFKNFFMKIMFQLFTHTLDCNIKYISYWGSWSKKFESQHFAQSLVLCREQMWVREQIQQSREDRSWTRAITTWWVKKEQLQKIWKQKTSRNCDWLEVKKRRKCLGWLPDFYPQPSWLDRNSVKLATLTESHLFSSSILSPLPWKPSSLWSSKLRYTEVEIKT